MNIEDVKKKWDVWFDSQEGKEAIEKFTAEEHRQEQILQNQLNYFHRRYSNRFSEIIERVVQKYESNDYYNRWMKRGYEPPYNLYWFLFYYAEKYGDKCTPEGEYWQKYGNMFTSAMYQINGYVFQRMDGQGSVIHVNKVK